MLRNSLQGSTWCAQRRADDECNVIAPEKFMIGIKKKEKKGDKRYTTAVSEDLETARARRSIDRYRGHRINFLSPS